MVLLNKRRSPLEESIWKAKSCLLLDIFCHVYVVVNPFFSKISCQINTLSMWVTVRRNQGCAWRMMCTHMKESLQRLTYNTTVECKPWFFYFFIFFLLMLTRALQTATLNCCIMLSWYKPWCGFEHPYAGLASATHIHVLNPGHICLYCSGQYILRR